MRSWMLGMALSALAAGNALAQDRTSETTIQVLGVGTVEDAPELATIEFTLRGEGTASDDAVRALVARRQAVENAIGSLPGAKVRLKTGSMKISEVRGRDCRRDDDYGDAARLSTGPCAIQGYVATLEATAETAPASTAGTLTGLAGRAGASDIRLSDFEIADKQGAKRRAVALAVANGQEQAGAIATASGGKLGRLLRVTDSESGGVGDEIVTITGNDIGSFRARVPVVVVSLAPKPIATTARLVLVYEILR